MGLHIKKYGIIYADPPWSYKDSGCQGAAAAQYPTMSVEDICKLPVKELSDKGCYVMLSNHNTILINELYKDFNIHVIEAKRNINSDGKKRGKVEEVIITNYEIERGFE